MEKDERNREEENTNELKDKAQCGIHGNDSVKFYCEAHEQPGCGHCVYLHHKKCDYVLIEDFNTAERDKIVALLNTTFLMDKDVASIKVQEKCVEDQECVAKIEEQNEEIRSELFQIKDTVDEAGDNPPTRLIKLKEARPDVEKCKMSLEDIQSTMKTIAFKPPPSRIQSQNMGDVDDNYKDLKNKYKATAERLNEIFDCDITHKRRKRLPCGHVTCENCYEKKPVYACFKCHHRYGNQPDGTQNLEVYYYDGKRYKITYTFGDGVQSLKHPSPGCLYSGTVVQTRLADNDKSDSIRQLLDLAFERKLLFTVDSRGLVVPNGVDMFPRGRPWNEYEDYLDTVGIQLAKLIG